jgi:hypothetical protein
LIKGGFEVEAFKILADQLREFHQEFRREGNHLAIVMEQKDKEWFKWFLSMLVDDAAWLDDFAERVEINYEELENTF